MKKTSIFLILIFIFCFTWTENNDQMPRDENNLIAYIEVVQVDGISRDQLYSKAQEWFAMTFNDSKSVIKSEDKDLGKIIGKGNIPVTVKNLLRFSAGVVEFSVIFQAKDDRYRYEFRDFIHDGSSGEYADGKSFGPLEQEKIKSIRISKKQWNSIKQQVHARMLDAIESFKKYLSEESIKKDEW